MADYDATRRADLIHMAQAQRKAEIEPDHIADNLGREPMVGIAGKGGVVIPTSVPPSALASRHPDGTPPRCPRPNLHQTRGQPGAERHTAIAGAREWRNR